MSGVALLKNITQGGNDSEWRNSNNLITYLEVILLYPRRVLLERLVADLHVIGPVLNIVLRENTIVVCGENTEYRFFFFSSAFEEENCCVLSEQGCTAGENERRRFVFWRSI